MSAHVKRFLPPLLTPLALVFILLAAPAFPADETAAPLTPDQARLLETLIEKARAREALFDGYDIKASAVIEGHASGTASFRNVFSRERFLMEFATELNENDKKESFSAKVASDGAAIRLFERDYDRTYGDVRKHTRENRFSLRVPTVASLGVTSIMQRHGPLSMHLAADNDAWAEWGRFKLRTTLKNPVTIDGRECIVVDCAIVREIDNTSATIERLYFAPDLDYACVKQECGLRNADAAEPDVSMTFEMSDFREVRPGLLLPFTIAGSEGGYTYNVTLDSVEFPVSFDDSLFTFDFPKGTSVQDQRLNASYTVGEASVPDPDSLVEEPARLQEDTNVPAPPLEEAANVPPDAVPLHEDTTEPLIEGTNVPSRLPLILLALAALCVVIAIVFLWRKRS